ncbi:hypothetical protein PIB30_005619 [Stylosanthes scabra]|uniref:Replication protein A 70 kDa DNA-binding subunit B/D first OB fold domain-containing protein n=1 Tax=Stylosanthes scabra TaxID=79078 RepID=A0ABU6S422_9FABA|nr:hypothetical protein [Stylosanthes scabra]
MHLSPTQTLADKNTTLNPIHQSPTQEDGREKEEGGTDGHSSVELPSPEVVKPLPFSSGCLSPRSSSPPPGTLLPTPPPRMATTITSSKRRKASTTTTSLSNALKSRAPFSKQITPWKNDWAIRVKIISIWEENTPSEEGEYKVLQMILMDGNLDKIQATAGNVDISGFSDILKEKGVYLITNFTMIPNVGRTRITKHRF